jgi:hypothetical protein
MEEQGSVKILESLTCLFQHLQLAESLMLCSSYDLEVGLLWQRVESRKPCLRPVIFKV